jgi:hypothetical protein
MNEEEEKRIGKEDGERHYPTSISVNPNLRSVKDRVVSLSGPKLTNKSGRLGRPHEKFQYAFLLLGFGHR